MTPRIWDTFLLRDELDMLAVRLTEFEKRDIAGHVLVEAATDHRGNPKPLHYAENKDRFAAWNDRIIHVVADLPENPNPWVREHIQRSHVWGALDAVGATDTDVALLCDVDEFPPEEAFTRLPEPVLAHRQKLAMYATDWLYPREMRCSVSCRVGYGRGKDATAIRDTREGQPAIDGGFHITWLGWPEKVRQKLGVHCHLEMTPHEYDLLYSGRCYREGIHHSGEFMMVPADVDETWPRMIFERKVPASWFRPRVPQPAGAANAP